MRSRAVLALASAVCMATIPAVADYAKKKDAKESQEARQFLQQISKDETHRTGAESLDVRAAAWRCRASEGRLD